MVLARDQSQWHDTADVHLRAVHVDVKLEFLSDGFDVLETFLIVGSCSANPYLHIVLDQDGSELAESPNDTFERGRDL